MTLINKIKRMKNFNTKKQWDTKILKFDTLKYNFNEWALSVAKTICPDIEDLEKMHLYVSPFELSKIKKEFHNKCNQSNFMEMIDQFMGEYIPPLIGNKDYLIQRNPTLRIVEPNQSNNGRRLWFHKGTWVGNGSGLRTVWMPFTRCFNSNSMQMINIDDSNILSQKCIDEYWSLEKFEMECIKNCFPINLNYGESFLFFQDHLHGNVNNETEITRVSMDIRILIKGENYYKKLPGGYFRFPGDYRSNIKQDNSERYFLTYDSWCSEYTKNIPLHLQKMLIDSYCDENKIYPHDSLTDNIDLTWFPALRSYIKQKPDGILMLSIFALPDKKEWRDEILNLALDNNVELHFANEYLILKTKDDLNLIQKYLEFSPS
jgi:sporadic carbohydrate cluster 2OG-Fe(II) oxygenase/sporadic carbohydrate cluster protein (TIGR04323 family)